ncbi:MAG: hypothetical protein HYV13_00195 [Candidatus Doudnabacteria bacterium]|nr:hypothetical protein [Candidatus Doudnabacteria bacterium]
MTEEGDVEVRREEAKKAFESALTAYAQGAGGTFLEPQLVEGKYLFQIDIPAVSAHAFKWFLENAWHYRYIGDDPSLVPEPGQFMTRPNKDKTAFAITGNF